MKMKNRPPSYGLTAGFDIHSKTKNIFNMYINYVEIKRIEYYIFDLNEMFDLLHHFTTKKLMKMKNRPPSAHKEFHS